VTIGVCLWCERISQLVWHHLTGDLDGVHWDPRFTVGLCAECHRSEHTAWRRAGIADLNDPLVARLARIAWTTGRAADLGCSLGPPELLGMNQSLNQCLRLIEVRQ